MESELIELFEAAKKAADAAAIDGVTSSGPEVSRSLDALKQLKKFPITYDMLVATQVLFKFHLFNLQSLDLFCLIRCLNQRVL